VLAPAGEPQHGPRQAADTGEDPAGLDALAFGEREQLAFEALARRSRTANVRIAWGL